MSSSRILISIGFCLVLIAGFAHASNRNFEPIPPADSLMEKLFGPVNIEQVTGDNTLIGCERDDNGFFWITSFNNLYRLTEDNGVWSLDTVSATGMLYDITYCSEDGYLYAGSRGTDIHQIDTATGYLTGITIPGPENPNRALAYDPATGHFWTANLNSNIYEFDRSGTIINVFPNTYTIYGMGFYNGRLFLHCGDGDGMLVVDVSTGASWDITELNGIAGGAAIIDWEENGHPYVALMVLGRGDYDFISGYEIEYTGPGPDTSFSASIDYISPTVPSINGDLLFTISVTNNGNATLPCWAELYPTIGDCVNGTIIDVLDLKKLLHPNLPAGETFSGSYFYHIDDVSGLNLSLCAIILDVGAGPDIYDPEARVCDEFMFYNPWRRTGGDVVWGEDWHRLDENIPTTTKLGQNYPNPFNATTAIPFDLDADTDINLSVYNLNGQLVETLIDGHLNAGHHNIDWDASSLSSGVYFYKLSIGDRVFSRRMTLLK
jgi:hypothetical protein